MIEENDNDDKLVIVPENNEYSDDAIKALLINSLDSSL